MNGVPFRRSAFHYITGYVFDAMKINTVLISILDAIARDGVNPAKRDADLQ